MNVSYNKSTAEYRMKVANHAIKTYSRNNEKDNTSATVKGQNHLHHGRNFEPKFGCNGITKFTNAISFTITANNSGSVLSSVVYNSEKMQLQVCTVIMTKS